MAWMSLLTFPAACSSLAMIICLSNAFEATMPLSPEKALKPKNKVMTARKDKEDIAVIPRHNDFGIL